MHAAASLKLRQGTSGAINIIEPFAEHGALERGNVQVSRKRETRQQFEQAMHRMLRLVESAEKTQCKHRA